MANTEMVKGSELKAGDVIKSSGYTWRVVAVEFDAGASFNSWAIANGGPGRYCPTVEWTGEGADPGPGYHSSTFGLRADLDWCRVVA